MSLTLFAGVMALKPWKCLYSIDSSPFFLPKWGRIKGWAIGYTLHMQAMAHSLVLIYCTSKQPAFVLANNLKRTFFHPLTPNFNWLSFHVPGRKSRSGLCAIALVPSQSNFNSLTIIVDFLPSLHLVTSLSPASLSSGLYYCVNFSLQQASLEGWAHFRVFYINSVNNLQLMIERYVQFHFVFWYVYFRSSTSLERP